MELIRGRKPLNACTVGITFISGYMAGLLILYCTFGGKATLGNFVQIHLFSNPVVQDGLINVPRAKCTSTTLMPRSRLNLTAVWISVLDSRIPNALEVSSGKDLKNKISVPVPDISSSNSPTDLSKNTENAIIVVPVPRKESHDKGVKIVRKTYKTGKNFRLPIIPAITSGSNGVMRLNFYTNIFQSVMTLLPRPRLS